MRVIAVLKDGPKGGREVTLIGQSAPEVLSVPEVAIPPPLDLGPPAEGEQVRRVTYWYRQSRRERGPAKWVHLYELDPADQDMTWTARHPAPPMDAAGAL